MQIGCALTSQVGDREEAQVEELEEADRRRSSCMHRRIDPREAYHTTQLLIDGPLEERQGRSVHTVACIPVSPVVMSDVRARARLTLREAT